MNEEIKVLDYGYVKLVETWGSDQSIIEAARMSTQKGFQGWGPFITGERIPCPNHNSTAWCSRCGGPEGDRTIPEEKPGDEKLLRYLYENAHSTPFEFAGMVIEVKAPIMVFREWHRHRSQGYNEASARYAPLPDENYLPTLERCMLGGGHVTKQAAAHGDVVLNETDALHWLSCLADVYEHCERVYQHGLRIGIPKELARLPVPVARYSKMRATTNLRMWLAFSTLRSTAKNPAAQWEIRQYADVVGNLLGNHFPRTWEIFSGVS